MSLFTSYEIENDAEFNKLLKDALSKVEDLSGAFGEISRDFFKSNKAVFSNSPGRYPDYIDRTTGTRGADTPYAKRKARQYGRVYPIMVASGATRDSLTKNNSDTILNIGKRSLAMGTNVKNSKGVRYPLFHQSDRERKTLPLRKILFIGPEASRFVPREAGRLLRWTSIIDNWVKKELSRGRT